LKRRVGAEYETRVGGERGADQSGVTNEPSCDRS
jgi:hypothetical protein